MARTSASLLLLFLAFGPHCSESASSKQDNPSPTAQNALSAAKPKIHRDWTKFPALVQVNTQEDIYVVGDPHADYDRLIAVLRGAKLISSAPSDPGKVSWVAGKAVVVFTGDYIDKGPDKYPAALKVISLLRALGAEAERAGGRVVTLMGNHEAEFLNDPGEKKVNQFAGELRSAGLTPDKVAACEGDIGEFLCSLPFAARVNDWFMSHAGNTAGRTVQTLENDLQTGVDRDGFASAQLIGDDSILEARLGDSPWFDNGKGDEEKTLKKYTSALGVSHIVQGHQPGKVQFSDGVRRDKGEMFQRYGLIFLEDTGMSAGVDDSDGAVLYIEAHGPKDAVAICPDGRTTVLWHSKDTQSLGRAKPCGR